MKINYRWYAGWHSRTGLCVEFLWYLVPFQRNILLPVYKSAILKCGNHPTSENISSVSAVSIVAENVWVVGDITLYDADFRRCALFSEISTIFAAILDFVSVTWPKQNSPFVEKSLPHLTLFTASRYLSPFSSYINLNALGGNLPPRCRFTLPKNRCRYEC